MFRIFVNKNIKIKNINKQAERQRGIERKKKYKKPMKIKTKTIKKEGQK